MRTPKRLALVSAAALLMAVVYGARTSSNETTKAALQAAKRHMLQLKKEGLSLKGKAKTTTLLGTADGKSRGRGDRTGRTRSYGASEVEPNDHPDEATPLAALQSNVGATAAAANSGGPSGAVEPCIKCTHSARAYGTIGFAGDVDYYSLDLKQGDLVRVSVDSDKLGAPNDLLVRVYGPRNPGNPADCGPQLAERDDGFGFSGVTTDPCTFLQAPVDGLYLVEVVNLPAAGGPDHGYQLTASLIKIRETEPNDDAAVANPLTLSVTDCVGTITNGAGGTTAVVQATCTPDEAIQILENVGSTRQAISTSALATKCTPRSACIGGRIYPDGDRDCFQVSLLQGQVLSAYLDGGKCGSTFNGALLLDPELEVETSNLTVAQDDDTDDTDPGILYVAQADAVHTLCVTDVFGSGGDSYYYQLHVDVLGCQGETEANNDCATANPVLCTAPPAQANVTISWLKLRNLDTGHEKNFARDSSWKANTTFSIDGARGTFDVSGNRCLQVGQTNGKLQVVKVEDPSGRLAAVCLSK